MDTASFVAYLRMEADMSDEKAKRLRLQADALAEQHGITADMESAFELHPEEMAPLDENGVPKYKGRKRGRKPKKRKRQLNPNRQKRQHTAYTLFVQENYPGVRAQFPDLQSKDIIGMVARQWASVPGIDKQAWKERAVETHENSPEGDENQSDNGEEDEEDEDEEDESQEEELPEVEEVTPKRRRGRPRKKS
mmetsp:Transcript_2773/g.4147  ORF Transcript_2773/g.4147 Transcript_2773/m.4147 type:complete len:193 (-) Transcript_2773:395-973(-)